MLPVADKQQQALDHIAELEHQVYEEWNRYWLQYSHAGTWQFWALVAMLLIPLVVLFFTLDKKRAFHYGFFGLNVHIWFTYTDIIGASHGYWRYPYKLHSVLPSSISLDTSLVPVAFMLVYQWSRSRERQKELFYYAAAVALSAVFAFVFKPLLVAVDLFDLMRGTNYFHLFLLYIAIALISKWLTQLFLWFQINADR
jgi:hypothetical protein